MGDRRKIRRSIPPLLSDRGENQIEVVEGHLQATWAWFRDRHDLSATCGCALRSAGHNRFCHADLRGMHKGFPIKNTTTIGAKSWRISRRPRSMPNQIRCYWCSPRQYSASSRPRCHSRCRCNLETWRGCSNIQHNSERGMFGNQVDLRREIGYLGPSRSHLATTAGVPRCSRSRRPKNPIRSTRRRERGSPRRPGGHTNSF